MNKTLIKLKRVLGVMPEHYKLYHSSRRVNKQAYVLLALFIISVVIYTLELLGVLETDIFTPAFALFLFIVLVPGPVLYIVITKHQSLVLTHEGIFKERLWKNGIYIPYEAITAADNALRSEVIIYGGKQKIRIDYTHYDDDLKHLEDILTYAGALGASPMRYVVSFVDNTLHVEGFKDNRDEESETLFNRFIDTYRYLTPGFFDDVMVYNAEITAIEIIDHRHVAWSLSHVDVTPNHPENPHFNAHKTDQAVVIFTSMRVERLETIDENGDVSPQPSRLKALVDYVNAGVISEINHKVEHKHVDMLITHGVERIRMQFTYKEFIAGWNGFEGLSWFEQKPNT